MASDMDPGFPPIRPGASISARLGLGGRPIGEPVFADLGQPSGEPSSKRAGDSEVHRFFTPVSDEDLDILLKQAGIPRDAQHREAARFLLRHHFVLSKDLVRMVLHLLPNGPWENHGPAEALVAALSRLPLDEVPQGFRILAAAFSAQHPMVMSLLHRILGLLQDARSHGLVESMEGVPSEILMPALEEELEQWRSLLNDPLKQIRVLSQRQMLATELRRLLLQMGLLRSVLMARGGRPDSPFLQQLATLEKEIRLALEMISSDSILSREDADRHFREGGHCVTLGLWNGEEPTPCRAWVEGEGDDEQWPWKFRLVWHSEILERLEAKLEVEGEQVRLRFSTDQEDASAWLAEHAEALEQSLLALGYELTQHPVAPLRPTPLDPEGELRARAARSLKHVDWEA